MYIKVTGHQYWWQFDYEEGFTAGQDVYIPAGEKVVFDLECRRCNPLVLGTGTWRENRYYSGGNQQLWLMQTNQEYIKENVLSFVDHPML